MAPRTRRPLARPSAFWDASALVPLFVRQGSTNQAAAWYRAYEVVIWWATPVEVTGALARMLRMSHLDALEWRKALKGVSQSFETWFVVKPSETVLATAIEIVERYDLRAADALQLAAALEWCDGVPRGHKFLTVDRRLQDAAILYGFDT